ncbi:right-handed parallel beta-helix repeat-containing protein [Cerasicoccus arenae]|uniref:Pectate lyase superfamily protein domain-containing protein n=1 Tax=Cerasicoccus arenae TaxID=424488 RepID=A0A8J3GEG4_9BACT|nr:hypothetical protein [Cerasicoccus arenae]MBK1859714.1 hypothetical protein [Cerasicoccus arenae]GHC03671.1 hypothetical protein GCM10007047_20370 [Cerasicoccus arenae]
MKRFFFVSLALFAYAALLAGTVHVSTFHAYPDDGIDDTAGINQAIAYGDNNIVLFDAGVYDLITPVDEDRFIQISNQSGIVLQGATTVQGKPNTTLKRHLSVESMASPPRALYVFQGTGITVKNFTIDNTPHLCTSGEVTQKFSHGDGTQGVQVTVFPGLPVEPDMPCYAANAWDSVTLDLKEVESLTYTNSPGSWSIVDSANRIVELSCADGLDFYENIDSGDYISWHYGWNGLSQMEIAKTTGVILENLEIRNAVNIAILIGSSADVSLTNIAMAANGNQLSVGPRDGIHLSRCLGTIVASGLDINRVRWDGLVVRTPYAEVHSLTSPNRFNMAVEIKTFSQVIPTGSTLTFIDSSGELVERTVSTATPYQMLDDKSYYDVTLTSDLPIFAQQIGTHIKIGALAPTSVSISNSNFENIAGASMILLADDITVENTTHRKIMFEAIHMGGHTEEGVAGANIQIRESTFENCSWINKWGQPAGTIILYNGHAEVSEAKLRNAVISDNWFKDQLYETTIPAINVADVAGITISGNTFENVYKGMRFDTESTSGYNITSNTVIIDNSNNDMTYSELSGTFGYSGLTGYGGSSTRYAWWSGALAEWKFVAPKSSDYDVYVYVVEHTSSDPSALISIESDDPTSQHVIDYTTGVSGWQYMGKYPYTGQLLYGITNQGQGGGYLRADAVMLIQDN